MGTRYKNPFCCGTDPTVYHMDLSAVAEHASIGGHLNRLERCGGRKPSRIIHGGFSDWANIDSPAAWTGTTVVRRTWSLPAWGHAGPRETGAHRDRQDGFGG